MVTQACCPSGGGGRKFRVIFNSIASPRPAWATCDSDQINREHKRKEKRREDKRTPNPEWAGVKGTWLETEAPV